MESIKQFSIHESFDYHALLDETIETILEAETELGSLESFSEPAAAEISLLRKLKEAQALFAPTLTVEPLSRKELTARNLTPTDNLKKWFKTHRFYLIQVPVTLRPSEGWLFNRLECWLGFDVPEVKIHALCPANSWVDILKTQTSLTLGINENFTFAAQAEVAPTTATAGTITTTGEAEATVGVVAAGGLNFVFGPVEYQLWRPQALIVGRENAQAFWHLDGGERVQKQEPYLAVVLRVPKAVTTLSASGALIAYHDYNRFAADRRDWWSKLRDKVKAFFQGGLPFQNQQRWENILNGVG